MAVEYVGIDRKLIRWLEKQFKETLEIEANGFFKVRPHDLVKVALYQLKSNIEGKTYKITYSKLHKCYIIKQI